MLPELKCELEKLEHQLDKMTAVTGDLLRRVMSVDCTRVSALRTTEKTKHIDHLIETEAWCDAIFALVDIELPAWRLRRLVNENGEWFCSLTRQPNLPIELDDTADYRHQVMPLAILGAFLEGRQKMITVEKTSVPSTRRLQPVSDHAICCDNFG